MLLAEPLFFCLVGVAALALVVITAPVWTAAAAGLAHWITGLLSEAGETIDESLSDDEDEHADKGKDG